MKLNLRVKWHQAARTAEEVQKLHERAPCKRYMYPAYLDMLFASITTKKGDIVFLDFNF
jgi:hypothetical protein